MRNRPGAARVAALLVVGCAVNGCSRAVVEPAGAQQGPPLLEEGFEAGGASTAYAQLLANPNLSLAPGEGVDGGSGLRARYVGSPVGSERIVENVRLPAPARELTLNYDVRFDRDFQFVKGGKLHGFGPRRKVTGGNPIRPDGWSARIMFGREGAIRTYTYHQDMKGKYGEGGTRARDFRFEPGRWHAVSLHVRVNDPASASNGFTRLYVDGQLVERREGVRFRGRDGDDTLITDMLFSTFHGGSDTTWTPVDASGAPTTVEAFFDNLAVHPGERIRQRPGQ